MVGGQQRTVGWGRREGQRRRRGSAACRAPAGKRQGAGQQQGTGAGVDAGARLTHSSGALWVGAGSKVWDGTARKPAHCTQTTTQPKPAPNRAALTTPTSPSTSRYQRPLLYLAGSGAGGRTTRQAHARSRAAAAREQAEHDQGPRLPLPMRCIPQHPPEGGSDALLTAGALGSLSTCLYPTIGAPARPHACGCCCCWPPSSGHPAQAGEGQLPGTHQRLS